MTTSHHNNSQFYTNFDTRTSGCDEHTPAADIMASWPKTQPNIAPLEPTLVVPLMSVGGQNKVRCRSECPLLGRVPGLTAAVSGLCFTPFQRSAPERHRPFWMHMCFQKPCVLPAACVPTSTAPFDHLGVDTPAEGAPRCCTDCLSRHQPHTEGDLTGDELRGRGCTDEDAHFRLSIYVTNASRLRGAVLLSLSPPR